MFGLLDENTKKNPKVMLTEADIKRLKKNHGVVLFFMDGCGHCVDMKDEWDEAVDECRNTGIGHENDDFVLGAIESGNTNLFKENGISQNVRGYPTILYISSEGIQQGNVNHEKYENDRKKKNFIEWITDKKNRKKGKSGVNNDKGEQYGGGRRRSRSRSRSRKSKSKKHMKRHTRRHKRTRRRRHMKGGGCGCGSGGLSSLFK